MPLVLVDQNAMIRELANDAGLAPSTVFNILKKQLGMWKITSRWVLYDLTESKMAAIWCSSYTLGTLWTWRWSLLMADHYYWRDLGQSLWTTLKHQSNKWRYGSPQKVIVRHTATNVETMLIIAYDWDGVIIKHTVPRRRTVTAEYYCTFFASSSKMKTTTLPE